MADELTTKERIYLNIIKRLGVSHSGMGEPNPLEDSPYFDYGDPEVGDIAFAVTSGVHPFTVGEVVEVNSSSDMVLKELGGGEECRIHNERFYTLKNFDESIFWGERKRRIARKVDKAVKRGIHGGYGHEAPSSAYYYRSRDLEFVDDSTVIVTIGPHAWASRGKCRFDVTVDVSLSCSIQSVLDQLVDAGFGNDLDNWPGETIDRPDECDVCGGDSFTWNNVDEVWECSDCGEAKVFFMGHAPTGE